MKLRTLGFVLVLSLLTATNCSNNDDDVNPSEHSNELWNLKNISGGFRGIDIDYEKGTVIWEFVSETGKLIVTNSVMDTGPQSENLPLQSGTYDYFFTESGNKRFLNIKGFANHDNGVYGRYEISQDQELTINQNEGSMGSGAGFFILVFD